MTAAAAAAPPTRYERSLLSCARALSDFARGAEAGAAWDEERFREWAREHRCEATKQAGWFVARLLRDKAANQSVGYRPACTWRPGRRTAYRPSSPCWTT
jgi:hypothetical protein